MAWLTRELQAICSLKGVTVVEFDWCQFGRPWRKRTRLAGTVPGLDTLGRRCCGGHEHLVLQGNTIDAQGRSVPRTALAAEYSPEFSEALCSLALAAPSKAHLAADEVVERLVASGASTLLWGSQEKDLVQHPRLSHLALGPAETCGSAWRTSQSTATRPVSHL